MIFLKKGTYSITAVSGALALFAISLCTEIRIPVGSINISATEAVLPIFIFVLWFRRNKSRDPMPALTTYLAIATITIAPIILSSDVLNGFPAARNIILPMTFALMMYMAKPKPKESVFAIYVLVCAALLVSILAIAQAELGTDKVFNLYTAHLIKDVSLEDVMQWKLGRAQSSEFLPGQKAVGVGLHVFSNNFGDYLVYAVIGVFTLFLAKAIDIVKTVFALAIIGAALLAALARTCWLGTALVMLLFGMVYMRSIYLKGMFGIVFGAIAIGLSGFFTSAVEFDRGGTVAGRNELNELGMNVYASAPMQNIIFGGSTSEYWDQAGAMSYPHNTFIFTLVYFGALGTLVTAIGIGATFLMNAQAVKRNQRDIPWALSAGGLAAISWLFIYGLTWAALANPNSLFMCSLFCSLAAANNGGLKIRLSRATARVANLNQRGAWHAKPLPYRQPTDR